MDANQYPDETTLLNQGDRFRPAWWIAKLPEPEWGAFLYALPAADREYRWITRADFLRAADAQTADRLPRVLVASYVWGTGRWAFLVGRRARVFRYNTPARMAAALTDVEATLRQYGPGPAYQSLLPGGINHLVQLGPSFFTKVLYVLDGRGTEPRRALILDQFVAVALNDRHDWGIPRHGPWDQRTYEKWLHHAHREAEKASQTLGRRIRADAVELEYFEHGWRVARKR